jgi:methylase of polypeptide subunit release factors
MSLFYKFQYLVGMTPWEQMPCLPIGEQAVALLDREESGREPPYGRALDLGCGTGIWSVRLAQRGWEVVGVDIVPKALRTARARAREAGVEGLLPRRNPEKLRCPCPLQRPLHQLPQHHQPIPFPLAQRQHLLPGGS